MQKQQINPDLQDLLEAKQSWLDLEQLAQIEITSEEAGHPIELAFTSNEEGWRAAQPGKQTIRLLFDEPQNIKQIQLLFREEEQDRTQEFWLSWLPAGAQSYREIVRQQYNFSPPDTIEELENYHVDLIAAKALELNIIPNINGNGTFASLAQLRLR